MSKSERFKRLSENRVAESTNPQKTEVIEKIVGDYDTPTTDIFSGSAQEQTSATIISNTATEHASVPVNRNSEQQVLDVSLKLNSDTEQLNVSEDVKTSSGTRIPKAIEDFEKRLKKPTIEETHTRGTWLIRNDLLKRLDKLARHQHRGFKTHLVNYALERVLDELENR